MKSIAELQKQQAQEMAALQAQLEIAAKLPGEPWYVAASRATGCPGASYKVKGLSGVLELVNKFEVLVPAAKYRDGSLVIRPVECLPEKAREQANGEFLLKLDVQQSLVGNYGPTAKAHFWARVEGIGIIEITADIEGPGYIGSFYALGCKFQARNGQVIKETIRPNPALYGACQDTVKWAWGNDSAFYSYLVGADYQNEDNEVSELGHLPAVLANLADEFDAKDK